MLYDKKILLISYIYNLTYNLKTLTYISNKW